MSLPMDELAANVLSTLKKPAIASETKLAQLNSLKSSIKHQRIPDSAQPATVECVRLAVASQTSPSLVAAGFSALTHLVKRLALQEQLGQLFSHRGGGGSMADALLERLGDAKEPYRSSASQAFCDIWPGKQVEVEKVMREGALVSGNTRAKLAAMQWVTKMHDEHNLQFRAFVPLLVACLEDADGTVREGAKVNLVELFRGSRDGAKADLKKQLVVYNVRKSIVASILSQLGIAMPSEGSMPSSTQGTHRSEASHVEHSASQEPSLPPSVEVAEIEPLYVQSARELEIMLAQMHPCFEDREKEDNWKARDNNVLKLRRLLKGNAPTEHHAIFVSGIKGLLDGILKVVHSLRTTLSTNGCQLVQELARTLGSGIDAMAEIILQSLEKMCSATKQIAAQNGNATVDTVLSYVSYNVRHMQHIWAATGDKNVQPRAFACGWLQTVLRKVSHHKYHFEHTGGLDLADKSIKRGLSDANPKVRESMRATYWVFAESWHDRATGIMDSLDAKSKQLLEQHQGNPNSSSASSAFTRSVGPDATNNPRLATSSSRASLKEQIAAQKKAALASKRMPDRPNSAMSSFTPVREAPSSARRGASNLSANSHARVPSSSSSHSSSRQPSTSVQNQSTGQGSLMSAPVRRPRRPEPPRPATADPYANRKVDTPPTSPKGVTQSSHTKSKSTTTAGGPIGGSANSSRGASPRTSPMKTKPPIMNNAGESKIAAPRIGKLDDSITSPSTRNEHFSTVTSEDRQLQPAPSFFNRHKTDGDRPDSSHSSVLETVEEDNFTLVIPEKSQIYGPKVSTTINADREVLSNSGEERNEDTVMVYEDPGADQVEVEASEPATKVVLEELPASEQNLQTQPQETTPEVLPPPVAEDEERPRSPKKPATPVHASDSATQDRAEVLKTRRLLASGSERIRAGTLDAHGFRRLQDLVKSNADTPDIHFATLLTTLLEYLTAPNDSLKVSSSKAQALKSQALSAARTVLSLHREEKRVNDLVPASLCAFIETTRTCESSTSHCHVELDKAITELIKRTQSDPLQVARCVDEVASLAEREAAHRPSAATRGVQQGHARQVTTALNALATLAPFERSLPTASSNADQSGSGDKRRRRLVALSVRCLGHVDPDVRRKAMEFAVVLHGCFPTEEQGAAGGAAASNAPSEMVRGKEGFWKLMRAAGEQQCNLVAYYLARKGKGM